MPALPLSHRPMRQRYICGTPQGKFQWDRIRWHTGLAGVYFLRYKRVLLA